MSKQTQQEKRQHRHKRVRAKIFGTAERPRLCVFRSNHYIYGQIIDDEAGRTLAASSDRPLKGAKAKPRTELRSGTGEKIKEVLKGVSGAEEAGRQIAQKAKETKIAKVVFDRGGYKYHGRIKAFAEGARAGGLEF